MFIPKVLVVVLCIFTFSTRSALAQTSAVASITDQQGVLILQQSLDASGALANPIHSFTADATITYFWAGQPVQGTAKVLAKGSNHFRMDATLPDGVHSSTASFGGGKRKEPNGKLTGVPAHNTMSSDILTLPYPAVAAALSETTSDISYLGLVQGKNGPVHQVRVVRRFPKEVDPDGALARLSRTDYFIDAQSALVIRTENTTHPIQSSTEDYSREIEFEQYSVMNGISVPTLVREKVAGQTTLELRISSIRFNPPLEDADLSLQ